MRLAPLILLALLTIGCGDTIIHNELPTSPTQTTTTTAPKSNLFEFRVSGNADLVRIVYSTPVDGSTQVVTSLPYQASFTSSASEIFLTISIVPISFPVQVAYPFISAQIVVNGNVFRQASSSLALSNPLEVSGTWRASN